MELHSVLIRLLLNCLLGCGPRLPGWLCVLFLVQLIVQGYAFPHLTPTSTRTQQRKAFTLFPSPLRSDWSNVLIQSSYRRGGPTDGRPTDRPRKKGTNMWTVRSLPRTKLNTRSLSTINRCLSPGRNKEALHLSTMDNQILGLVTVSTKKAFLVRV